MIDFYTWNTPNGHKVAIMLEELKLPYTLHPINIGNKEQFNPAFLKINPNNKIPAIIDQDGPQNRPINIFESGAILIYLAEKSGKFLPKDPRARMETLEWLMFQMGGVGPMLGQLFHFQRLEEKIPYAIDRYMKEADRLFRVMNDQLKTRRFFAEDYSIADIAIFPWVNIHEKQDINLETYPKLKAWHAEILGRPAVQKALQISDAITQKSSANGAK